jgi:hypothetical protein
MRALFDHQHPHYGQALSLRVCLYHLLGEEYESLHETYHDIRGEYWDQTLSRWLDDDADVGRQVYFRAIVTRFMMLVND